MKLTRPILEKALIKLDGNMAEVGRHLGVTRQAVSVAVKRLGMEAVLEEASETMLDDAENALGKAIRNGEAWAVCFYLKTKGKRRGYIERQEFSGPDGKPVETRTEIVFTYDDSKPGRADPDADG